MVRHQAVCMPLFMTECAQGTEILHREGVVCAIVAYAQALQPEKSSRERLGLHAELARE